MCGDEQLGLTTADTFKFIKYINSGDQFITTAQSLPWFTLANTGTDCFITGYSLHSDTSGLNLFSDPKVRFDTSASPISLMRPIKVLTSSVYSLQLFLQAKTYGGVAAYKPLQVEICNRIGYVAVDVPIISIDYDMDPIW